MNIAPQQMEMFVASQLAESLGGSPRLMEIILERRNMFRAINRVREVSCGYLGVLPDAQPYPPDRNPENQRRAEFCYR